MKKGYQGFLKQLLPYIRPHKKEFFLSIIFDIFSIICSSLVPLLSGFAIDLMISYNVNFTLLTQYLVAIIVVAVFGSIFEWFGVHNMNVLTYKTAQKIRNSIYEKLNKVPLKYVDNNSHGDVINTMIVDVENLTDGFLEGFKTIVCGIFQIVVVMILMFVLKWSLALIVVILAPLSLVLANIVNKKSKKLFEAKVQIQGDVSGYAEEMITNMKITKAYSNEQAVVEKFKNMNSQLAKTGEKSSFYALLAHPASRFVNGILYGVIGVVGAFMAIAKQLRIGIISSFLNYAENFTKPFNEITSIYADLNIAVASAGRVFELLGQSDEISDEKLPSLKQCNKEVKLKDVEFSYTKAFKLIENLNLDVKAGQRVAIVGPTGCGKSTIINLLMRFYDVDNGAILVSNRDIRKVKRKSFRQFYGMVLQESWLYNASIRDNVAYGKPNASFDEVVEACKLANAHAFIEKLPQGYNTIISERADNISAGQKQLLCIARIMLLKPPMIILDEATSNIDTRTEMKIQQALDKVMEGCTCFIVAHRLSTIVNADTILVMNKGKIVEQGKHLEVLERKGFYYELFNSQFSS